LWHFLNFFSFFIKEDSLIHIFAYISLFWAACRKIPGFVPRVFSRLNEAGLPDLNFAQDLMQIRGFAGPLRRFRCRVCGGQKGRHACGLFCQSLYIIAHMAQNFQ